MTMPLTMLVISAPCGADAGVDAAGVGGEEPVRRIGDVGTTRVGVELVEGRLGTAGPGVELAVDDPQLAERRCRVGGRGRTGGAVGGVVEDVVGVVHHRRAL